MWSIIIIIIMCITTCTNVINSSALHDCTFSCNDYGSVAIPASMFEFREIALLLAIIVFIVTIKVHYIAHYCSIKVMLYCRGEKTIVKLNLYIQAVVLIIVCLIADYNF